MCNTITIVRKLGSYISSISNIVESLYFGRLEDKYKCPNYRSVLSSVYYKAQFGTFVSILNTGVSSFQGVPNKVLL